MFSKNHTPKIILISILSILVSSCGGGDGNTPQPPPVVPKAIVSGNVIIGPVENASVTIYEIKNNIPENSSFPVFSRTRLKDLGNNVTDADGFYSIELQIDKPVTPILVCSTGGSYYEPASPADSPKLKTIGTDQELCSVALFKRGKNMSVHITPFSHLAYSFAKSKIESGEPLIDTVTPATDTSREKIEFGAITLANKSISDWLQLQDKEKINQGVISVKPLSISDSNSNKGSIFRAGNKYGFAIAAISDLVELLRLDAGGKAGEEFVGVSSFEYAQRLFEDMQDGFLNAQVNSGPFLRVGGNDLSLHIIRHHFALKIFAVTANTSVNKTGFTIGQVKDFVTAVNVNASPDLPAHSNAVGASTIASNNHGVLFDGDPEELIDNTDITISHIFPKDNYVMKDIENIRVEVFDISGIQSIGLTIMPAGKKIGAVSPVRPRELAADPLMPSWIIDTNAASPEGLPDGSYDLVFDALSNAGKSKFQTVYSVNVSNSGVSVILNNPRIRGDGDVNAIALNPDYAINSIVNFKATVTDKFFYDTVTDPSNRNQPISDFIKFTINDPNNANLPIINIPLVTGANPPPFSKPNSTTRIYNAGTVLEPLTNGAKFLDTNGNLIEGKYQLEVYAMSGIAPVLADPNTGQAAVDPVSVTGIVNFAFDKTPPIATIATASKAFPGSATIVGTFSDPNSDPASTVYGSGLMSASITENSSVLKDFPRASLTSSIEKQVIFNLGKQGWHNIKLKVTDRAGNSFETGPVEMGFDDTKPTVQINRGSNNVPIENNWWRTLNITTKITDNATGIKTLVAGYNTTLLPIINTSLFTLDNRSLLFTYPEQTFPDPAIPIPNGIYSYTVTATDHAGLSTTDKILGIGIDTTYPVIDTAAFNSYSSINYSSIWYGTSPINTGSTIKYLTIDMTKTVLKATLYVDHRFFVNEPGYQPTGISKNSGISKVKVGGKNYTPTSNSLGSLYVTPQTKHVLPNLPRLIVKATATQEQAWTVDYSCRPVQPDVAPITGTTGTNGAAYTMILTAVGQCQETKVVLLATGGNGTKIVSTFPPEFFWVKKGTAIYPVASETTNFNTLKPGGIKYKFAEQSYPVLVISSDLALPTPNTGTEYYCVGMQAINKTPDVTVRTNKQTIGTEVNPPAYSPVPINKDPSAMPCFPSVVSLTPRLLRTNVNAPASTTTCNLRGQPKTIESSSTPTAAIQKTNIVVKQKVYAPVDFTANPPVCLLK